MIYEWDDYKAALNYDLHGVSFHRIEAFDWASALIALDDRFDYGEDRYVAIGTISARLHVVVFTDRNGVTRIISLRKANKRECKFYEQKT